MLSKPNMAQEVKSQSLLPSSVRQVLFISHAAPEDNEFSRWLSLQLIGLGYKVWCDVLELKGGEDFWSNIEKALRANSIKFLYVLSKTSNQRDGTLKELAVAQKVKKQLQDDQFIIPIHIDNQLSYDDVNIELNRLNSINFKRSWAEGLKNLMVLLEEQQVPKAATDFDAVNQLWRTVFLQNKEPMRQEEIYFSNWFPIVELASIMRFHRFGRAIPKLFDINQLQYPAVRYGDYLATFAHCYDFIEELTATDTYDSSRTIEISLAEILNGTYNSEFINNREAKKILIQLLNKAFDKTLRQKPVSVYEMSNHLSFWIRQGVLEKDKFNKILLVGKQKEKQWHFGISGSIRLFPEKCFVINAHIWFTSDGQTLISEAGKQHAARRKQGKNWWNNDWRSKTLAFMDFLAEGDQHIWLRLGQEEYAKIATNPLKFHSPVTYQDPNSENLPEDDVHFYEGDDDNNEIPTEDE